MKWKQKKQCKAKGNILYIKILVCVQFYVFHYATKTLKLFGLVETRHGESPTTHAPTNLIFSQIFLISIL